LNKWCFLALFQGAERSILAALKSAIRRLIPMTEKPVFISCRGG
jgi:hypothetical protein